MVRELIDFPHCPICTTTLFFQTPFLGVRLTGIRAVFEVGRMQPKLEDKPNTSANISPRPATDAANYQSMSCQYKRLQDTQSGSIISRASGRCIDKRSIPHCKRNMERDILKLAGKS
jgi:hypothetical protein